MTTNHGSNFPARRFGQTDVHLTPIALGAMLMGTVTAEAEARRILDHYIGEVTPRFAAPDGSAALGMIDTADCYCWWEARGEFGGHSEALLARWFAATGVRDRVYLATKGSALMDDLAAVWTAAGADWNAARSHYVGASPETLQASLAGSLSRLQTRSVDLYYVHVDDRRVPLERTLATLAEFVADGRIGAYGWSNVRTWRLAEIRATCNRLGLPQPIALQQQHSYLRLRAGARGASIVSDEQLDYLESHSDLQLVAYSPILKGLYSTPAKRSAEFWAMAPYAGPDADARFAAVDRVAAATGATGNQVVLAWMLAQSSPRVVPLIGPRTFDQYLECIEALDVTLTPEQLAELGEAGA